MLNLAVHIVTTVFGVRRLFATLQRNALYADQSTPPIPLCRQCPALSFHPINMNVMAANTALCACAVLYRNAINNKPPVCVPYLELAHRSLMSI